MRCQKDQRGPRFFPNFQPAPAELTRERALRTIPCSMPRNARNILNEQFLEMRWRALSLAADLDRIERAPGGRELLASDPRLTKLRDALKLLLQNEPERAANVQMIFSDMTPPPPRTLTSAIGTWQ